MNYKVCVLMTIAALGAIGPCVAGETLHHQVEVRLEPEARTIQVADSLTLEGVVAPDAEGAYRFVLHAGLAPRVATPGWRLEILDGPVTAGFFGINATTDTVFENVPLEAFLLIPGEDSAKTVKIVYGGEIHHSLATQGEEYQRSFSETPGIIDEIGVFLSGTSFWVPTFGDGLLTFDLEVSGLEKPWGVVSQGRRLRHEIDADGKVVTVWQLVHPTEEIYLVAGPWHEYSRRAG